MTALTRYMDFINFRRSFVFGQPPLDVYADYVEVRQEVEAMGTPEILSGDGEYSIDVTAHRTNEWLDAITELNEIEQELVA